MKKIIYRFRSTGEISHDADPEDYQTVYDEESLVKKINAYNREGKILRAEIVELDDIAEFYAKRAGQCLNTPEDIAEQLRNMADRMTDIADKIEEEVWSRE